MRYYVLSGVVRCGAVQGFSNGLNFHTFTSTGNIAMCWEPDPMQRSPVFNGHKS